MQAELEKPLEGKVSLDDELAIALGLENVAFKTFSETLWSRASGDECH